MKYIRGFSEILKPITLLTQEKPIKIKSTKEGIMACEKLKDKFCPYKIPSPPKLQSRIRDRVQCFTIRDGRSSLEDNK
jgi:hypothetical protein